MSKSIKVNIFWNTFGSIFYSACQWLLTIIIVRVLSYEAAGYLSLAMTTSSSFSAIALFSVRNYQVSDVAGEYSSGIYVGSRLLTSVAALVCCFLSSLFIKSSFNQFLCIMAFMLIRLAEAIADVLHGINQKYERYDYIGISYIMRGIITVVSFSALLIISENLPLTLLVVAILNFIIVLVFDWWKTYSIDHFEIIIKDEKIWKLIKKCAPIVISTFLLSLENLIPKSILQIEYGAEHLGIYSSIASPTLVVQVFASVVFGPFLPVVSIIIYNGEKDKFKVMMHKVYLACIGMSIAVTFGAILLGRLGLQILFGKDILQYYSIFIPIVWCTILTGIVWILSSIVVALRKIKTLLWGMVLDFIICTVLSLYIIRYMGMNGVSVVQIVALIIYIVFMIVICETADITNEGKIHKKEVNGR